MTEPEFNDWIATLDQFIAGAKDIARIERAYFNELIEVGFTRGEALVLTAHFQKTMLNRGEGED